MKTRGVFTNFTEKDGLPNNVVYGVLEDGKHRFWLSTNAGITCITLVNNKIEVIRTYDKRDGMPSNEFNGMAFCKNANGEMFFGSNQGFTHFNPDEISDNLLTPQVYITGFQVFNKPFLINKEKQTTIEFTDTITLTYKQNMFSLEFAALNFINPEKNKFAYKLDGFDRDWIYTTSLRRYATYTNLDPGNYTFRVKACNNDGYWNNNAKCIYIVISPPYWQTWWFRALIILSSITIIGLSVYVIATTRLKKRLLQLQREKEIYLMRSRISSDIHDDVGAGLSKIALLSEIGKLSTQHDLEAKNRFNQLSKTAGELIDSLHEIIWSINPKHDSLKNFIGYLRNYTYEYFENTTIILHANFPDKEIESTLAPEFRRNIFLIIKECYNNVLKHSEAQNVFINIALSTDSNQHFKLTINDDGKGFNLQETENKGNGLINIKDRANQLSIKIQIESTLGNGTSITLEGNWI